MDRIGVRRAVFERRGDEAGIDGEGADPEHACAATLPEGEAGEIVRYCGEAEVLINRLIPLSARPSVARHLIGTHGIPGTPACDVRNCVQAVRWLRAIRRTPADLLASS